MQRPRTQADTSSSSDASEQGILTTVTDDDKDRDFAEQFQQASEQRAPSMAGEFTAWLAHNKKWWLAPVLVVTLLLGLVLVLQGSALGQWIYALL